MKKESINFYCPSYILESFDGICRASGKTRTAVLVELMRDYPLSHTAEWAKRDKEIATIQQILAEIATFHEETGRIRREAFASSTDDVTHSEAVDFYRWDGQRDW